MSDLGILCSICLGKDHTASSCPMRKKFKNSNGQLLRRGIFHEEAVERTNVMYTLRDEDYVPKQGTSHPAKGYPSLYRLYMDMMDVTEYEFATTYFHSWKHWLDVSNSPWFKPYITRWRQELELKLKVRAIKEIMHEASSGGKNSFAANKWLVEKGWAPANGPGRGRPSKQEIKQTAFEMAQDESIIDKAYERIMN